MQEANIRNKDPLIGTILADRYLITGKLGEGGMGMVYEAKQQDTKRPVALKVLHPSLCKDPATRARFQVEAEIASRLKHQSSVTVLDFGEKDGFFFLAMELIAGDTLRNIVEDHGPIEWRRAISITKQICGSLQDAHDRHVIHRDLKSENIMLTRSSEADVVKVLDFGIAKILDADGSDQRAKLTQTGMVIGTPKYMSPEQIRGEKLDPRTDIYSLGVILYEMLAGRLPFESDSPMGMLTKHLNDSVQPILVRNPDVKVPPLLENVIFKAMSKERDQRHDSMADFSSEIEHALSSTAQSSMDMGATTKPLRTKNKDKPSSITAPTKGPTQKRGKIRPVLILIAVVIALTSLTFIGWSFLPIENLGKNSIPSSSGDTGSPSAGNNDLLQGSSNAEITGPANIPTPIPSHSSTCTIQTDNESLSLQISGLLSSQTEYIESCAIYENLNAPLEISFMVKPRKTRFSSLKSNLPTNTDCLVSILQSKNLKRAPKSKRTGTVHFYFEVKDRSLKQCRIQIKTDRIKSTTGNSPPSEDVGDTDDVEVIPIEDMLPSPETIKDKLDWIKDQIKQDNPSE